MIAVASTLGVLIPPSLVLILLSDAMLSAHTIAVTQTGRTDRVINTQDVFHAALLPAGIFLVFCITLAWFVGRKAIEDGRSRTTDGRSGNAGRVSPWPRFVLLLGGVATGYFYAVEAAAMGGFALLVAGLLTRAAEWPRSCAMLFHDAIAITGALFFLLLAATTFTLVLRLLGTDRLVNNLVGGIPGRRPFLPSRLCWE